MTTWTWKTDPGDKPGTALLLDARAGKVESGKFVVLDPGAAGDLAKGLAYDLENLVQDGNRITCNVTVVDGSSPGGHRRVRFTIALKRNLEGETNVDATLQGGSGAVESIVFQPQRTHSR